MAVGDLADEIKYNKRQKRAKKTVQAQARKKRKMAILYTFLLVVRHREERTKEHQNSLLPKPQFKRAVLLARRRYCELA